jgi:hypothetical protein
MIFGLLAAGYVIGVLSCIGIFASNVYYVRRDK